MYNYMRVGNFGGFLFGGCNIDHQIAAIIRGMMLSHHYVYIHSGYNKAAGTGLAG